VDFRAALDCSSIRCLALDDSTVLCNMSTINALLDSRPDDDHNDDDEVLKRPVKWAREKWQTTAVRSRSTGRRPRRIIASCRPCQPYVIYTTQRPRKPSLPVGRSLGAWTSADDVKVIAVFINQRCAKRSGTNYSGLVRYI